MARGGDAMFLVGAFCALCAQGSGRRAWAITAPVFVAKGSGNGEVPHSTVPGLVAHTAQFCGGATLESCDSASLTGVVGLKPLRPPILGSGVWRAAGVPGA